MSDSPNKPLFQFGLASLFGLTAAFPVLWLVAQSRMFGIVVGPFLLPDWPGYALAVGLVSVMALLPIKRTASSVVAFMLAATAWLLCGIVGMYQSI